jgi:hypothetical protein
MRTAISRGLMVTLMAVTVGGAAGVASADEWTKTYTVSGHANLNVSTGDGEVNMSGTDGKQIVAKVTTWGWKIGPNDVDIEESQNGDTVTINVKTPHWSMGWGHKGLKVDLAVPRDLDAEIHTGDGNISVRDAGGNLRFETGDGNVTAATLRGNIDIKTGDGNITGQGFDGSIDAQTGDGNMTVQGRFDTVHVKSGDGNVEVEAANGSKIATRWEVLSGDGRISLRLPESLQADLDARTGDGEITLGIPVQVVGSISRSSVHGKLNGGGGEISVRSGDGSIHVEKL